MFGDIEVNGVWFIASTKEVKSSDRINMRIDRAVYYNNQIAKYIGRGDVEKVGITQSLLKTAVFGMNSNTIAELFKRSGLRQKGNPWRD